VAERQSSWSGHPLFFFQNTTTPSEIYLVTGWTSVGAHEEWIEIGNCLRWEEGWSQSRGSCIWRLTSVRCLGMQDASCWNDDRA
ncbi:hypothetical protein BKA93DRAFT_743807, partial [Sparassis latifolia]